MTIEHRFRITVLNYSKVASVRRQRSHKQHSTVEDVGGVKSGNALKFTKLGYCNDSTASQTFPHAPKNRAPVAPRGSYRATAFCSPPCTHQPCQVGSSKRPCDNASPRVSDTYGGTSEPPGNCRSARTLCMGTRSTFCRTCPVACIARSSSW